LTKIVKLVDDSAAGIAGGTCACASTGHVAAIATIAATVTILATNSRLPGIATPRERPLE
jgi:hypothetical protein